MKKLSLILAALSLLAVTGCEKHSVDASTNFSGTGLFLPQGGDVANGTATPGVSK